MQKAEDFQKENLLSILSFSLHHLLEIQNVKIYCACEAAAAAAKKSASAADDPKKVEGALFCTEHSTQHSLPLQNCYSLFQTTLLLKFTVCLEL